MEQEQERGITITSAATILRMAGLRNQHYRYAGPRGFHGRGGAQPAGARWRGGGFRRGGRRPAAVGDGVAAGGQVPRSAHLLHQQDGPRRRGLLPLGRDHRQAAEVPPGAHSDPGRRRGPVQGHRRPGHDESAGVARRDAGRAVRRDRDSRGASRRRQAVPRPDDRGGLGGRRAAVREVRPRRGDQRRRDCGRGCGARTIVQKIFPVICGSAFKNKGVQNLLDAVVDYLPSPVEDSAGRGHRSGRSRARSSSAGPTTTSLSRRWCSRS